MPGNQPPLRDSQLPLSTLLIVVSVGLALLVYSLLPAQAATATLRDASSVEAIPHADALHGRHVFLGADQWTYGNNELCQRESSGATVDAAMRCPAACEEPAVQQGRVRRALHTLSDEEWARVVAALRTMHEVPTAEGVARFGSAYRDYSFHTPSSMR